MPDSATTYASDFRQFLHDHRSQDSHPQAAESYTGSVHTHYGVSVPAMRSFLRSWIAAHKQLSPEQFATTLTDLYHGDSLEEHVFAGMMLSSLTKLRQTVTLAQLEAWLEHLEGWAEVDSTCQSTFPPAEVLGKWDQWQSFLRQLSRDPNVNKRRASLVLLIRTLRESPDPRPLELAFELVDALKADKDKRITKAISWVLREATKQHKAAILQYMDQHDSTLPKIAVREIRTKLATGKK